MRRSMAAAEVRTRRVFTPSCRAWGLSLWLILAAMAGVQTLAAAEAGVGTNELAHLAMALQDLAMTLPDLGFKKDIATPCLASALVLDILGNPWEMIKVAEACAADVPGPAAYSLLARLWDTRPPRGLRGAPAAAAPRKRPRLDAGLAAALARFEGALAAAQALTQAALARVPAADREFLAADLLAGVFNAEDDPRVREQMVAAGMATGTLAQVLAAGVDLAPEPAMARSLDALEQIDYAALLAAGTLLHAALADLVAAATNPAIRWPARPQTYLCIAGRVVIGSPAADTYAQSAALVLDPGGDDLYGGRAAQANGLLGQGVGVVLDLAGDDRYASPDLIGAGTALWGVCLVRDLAGRDQYDSTGTGQGAGLFGLAWLEDDAGDDVYQARALAQGAGYAGLGLLRDKAGQDLYQVGQEGQGYAGVKAVGLLADESGHDRYLAGLSEPDHERHQHRFVSAAQGCAMGLRAGAGGGVALLLDRAGNDTYEADVFGQGVGYWYALGMLIDLGGHDSYRMYEYGQGAGIHVGAGLLYDAGGEDLYCGVSLAQGAAHDYGVGVLCDRAGGDRYVADRQAQGRAINNSLALLLDVAGDDAYFGASTNETQGIGHAGGERESGSIALLLDLAGRDMYTGGATNGARDRRPDYGLVYDVLADNPPSPAPAAATAGGPCPWDDYDALMRRITRYGNTPERRAAKDAARAEIKARGPAAFDYLLRRSARANMWFYITAREMFSEPGNAQYVPQLVAALADPDPAVRKLSVYLLGFCPAPELAPRILPFLDDPLTAGAAMRTLGKWRVAAAAPRIVPGLRAGDERRRIIAANALGEIGAPWTAPALAVALGDPVFTVRYAAARALLRMAPRLRAGAGAVGPAARLWR